MTKFYPAYSSILIFLASMYPCGVSSQAPPRPGQIISDMRCESDSTQSYALFLPSYYNDDPEAEFPVIYAFDAAARGITPVELFSEAAEKYGYIIAGSNISENGPWEPILRAAETMMNDVESRFRIDKARRYTTGFSGGARVATSLAVLYGTFEGVIGCGAGFSPNYPPYFDLQTCYIGLVGNCDFNYQEMMHLDEWLTKFNIDHYIYEYSGGHEWPPKEVITNAVTWLQFRAMKNDLIWTDYNLREEYYEDHLNLINSFIQQANFYAAYREAEELHAYLNGVRNMGEVDAILVELKNNPEVRAESANIRRILEEERAYYNAYLDAFEAYKKNYENSMTAIEPMSYWKDQVKIAWDKIDNGKSYAENLLGRRMLDFLWRTAYQEYENVLGTEYEPVAKKYLDIWLVLQPQAITPYFYMAKYYAGEGKYAKAINYLQLAIDQGLDDEALIQNDSVLVQLMALPEYRPVEVRLAR